MVLNGLRGVGKTVLLNELATNAKFSNWIVAKIEADLSSGAVPFRSQLAQALTTPLRHTHSQGWGERLTSALATFKSFSVGVGLDGFNIGMEIEPAIGRADTGSLSIDLTDLAVDLGTVAHERNVGVAIFIDEMQDLTLDDLGALCHASHAASQETLPFFVIGAGLPNLPSRLAEAKTYSERLFEYVPIGRLNEDDAAAALVHPAEREGVTWEPAALDAVVTASDGYPYFIQQFGQTTWDAAATTTITGNDAVDGIAQGRRTLDGGFFRARWERATNAERAYLIAMAADGDGPSPTGEVAQRLDKKPTSLGPVRANLIAKGLVYPPEHGLIAFTVPGMADFISRDGHRP